MKEIKLGFWEEMKNGIRNHLKNEDISTFQNWSEIRQTMIAGANATNNYEYEYLINDEKWEYWKDKLEETVLKPNSHVICDNSSTNNIHHAYSLQILMEEIGCKLHEFDDVIEFGGGYGNMCRLFNVWGHDKPYYLYDIPELIEIQKYYLRENGVTNNIFYKSEHDVIDSINGNSLFLGMWSISEVPINERDKLLENLKFFDCNNIFLAMGDIFKSENNLNWINSTIIPRLESLDYTNKLFKIERSNNMYYFVATKK